MKQHITSKQAHELSREDQATLKYWWQPVAGDCWVDNGHKKLHYIESEIDNELPTKAQPLFSIGQMIDFLGDIQLHDDGASWVVISDRRVYMPTEGNELCDSLWEAMKGEVGRPKQLEVDLRTQTHNPQSS